VDKEARCVTMSAVGQAEIRSSLFFSKSSHTFFKVNINTDEQVSFARMVLRSGDETIGGMASVLGVHRNTLSRAIDSDGVVKVK